MSAATDVVELTQRLVRIDTSNPPGRERAAVEALQLVLARPGIETVVRARDAERPNLVARVRGRGDAPPLLMYGHVDVVPVAGQTWTRPPFSGDVVDGVLWGRGAIDMKSAVAQMVGALIHAAEAASPPAGDIVFAAFSDEECGSEFGARFMVEHHAELFEGVRFALGEFGAVSLQFGDTRFYPIQVAEKQWCTVRLTAVGPAGHGSVPVRGGAVAALAEALVRLDAERLPVHVTSVAKAMVTGFADGMGGEAGARLRALLDPAAADAILDAAGPRMGLFDAALHNTASATQLSAATRPDAIPGAATAIVDGRIVPGSTPGELVDELRAVCGPAVEIEIVQAHQPGNPDPDMGLFDTLAAALTDEDPEGIPIPMLMPGMTDGRWLARLGIQSYGYTPLKLPPGFPLREVIHSPDERVPVESLVFGQNVLNRVVERYAAPA